MSTTPPQSPEDSGLVKRTSRKSHRKSRNGCLNCKQRRVKCGEEKPACLNCIKHSSRCSFLQGLPARQSPESTVQTERQAPVVRPLLSRSRPSEAANQTPSRSPVLSEAAPPMVSIESRVPSINIADLELLHHYDTSTSYTLATIPELQTFLRLNVPRIAFQHPLLLHAILALSSLHLSHSKPDSKTRYLASAHHHYSIALETAISLLQTINEENCSALYIFSALAPLFTLGTGPKPGDFVLFNEEGVAQWLRLRGLRTMLESHPAVLESELSPMFSFSSRQTSQVEESANPHLQALRTHILDSGPDVAIYLTALDELAKCFPVSRLVSPSTSPSPQALITWLYRLSEDFVTHLQQRDPIALVILAHFCVALNKMHTLWWVGGWVDHLLRQIHGSLDAEKRGWIRGIGEGVGWIPC